MEEMDLLYKSIFELYALLKGKNNEEASYQKYFEDNNKIWKWTTLKNKWLKCQSTSKKS